MNIENSIPQGWKLGYIMAVYTRGAGGDGYECQMELKAEGQHHFYTHGDTPTQAFTKACDKAREYNIRRLMEECLAREDSLDEEDSE